MKTHSSPPLYIASSSSSFHPVHPNTKSPRRPICSSKQNSSSYSPTSSHPPPSPARRLRVAHPSTRTSPPTHPSIHPSSSPVPSSSIVHASVGCARGSNRQLHARCNNPLPTSSSNRNEATRSKHRSVF